MNTLPVQSFENFLVYDSHACPSFNASNISTLERYLKAGVTCVSLNIGFGDMSEEEIIIVKNNINREIIKYPELYIEATCVNDILRAKIEKKLAIVFDLEGINWIKADVEKLALCQTLGVKQMVLAYNKSNSAGGGCQEHTKGLTQFGKKVVKKMNQFGIIIDCSHAGIKTTYDIMETSMHPVVFSHSNPFSLCEHERNITDKQIKICAQVNGVIGINGISLFLHNKDISSKNIVENIDYIAQLVGSEHVGLGLDYVFDSKEVSMIVKKKPNFFPENQGYHEVNTATPEQFQEIFSLLLNRGYSKNDLENIMGKNFLRVASAVWKEI
jgi:membrane dipeptidase